jgi:hypothetical protein
MNHRRLLPLYILVACFLMMAFAIIRAEDTAARIAYHAQH